jgi:hypothetical protein
MEDAMKTLFTVVTACLLLLLGSVMSIQAQDGGVVTEKYSVWVGGHYSSFDDYTKKVGEYLIGTDEFYPEFRINYLGVGKDNIFRFDGHYYDKYDINGRASATISDMFKFNVMYRSLIHQLGQDMLENLSARELIGTNPGGKMLLHDIEDPGADYNIHRQEILSHVEAMLSREHNVKLTASHRTILEDGTSQDLSVSHCFSCHVVSRTAEVDERTHEFEVGVQGDIAENMTVGYEFDYRHFSSHGPTPYAYYDEAKHPVRGDAQAEFGSRLNYNNVSLPSTHVPTIEKIGNKVRFNGDFGKSKLATSLAYNITTNKYTDLEANAWTGAASFATILSPRTRLVLRATGVRLTADDPYIELPIWREGRPGPQVNFDYRRLSSLDRTDGTGTAELIHRLNRRLTLSVLGGYQRVDRYDYPAENYVSNTLIGQARLSYRSGMNFSAWAKYRIESTDDPFVSARGLFEARGRESLGRPVPDVGSFFAFIFYYEREGLRYQTITTEPTIQHDIQAKANVRLSQKANINLGIDAQLDKNTELDSLDVKHTYFRPSLALNLMPNQQWTFSGGYTLNYSKSTGPITVALFDG